MSSTSDIQAKWQERKNSGLDLGAAAGAEQDAGWGGRVQVYQNGRIYWHKVIGTHEVHGGILTKYLQMGATGINPATSRRSFGFPASDETRTPDGDPVSYFEWGAIYWLRGAGAVSLYGAFYEKWKSPTVALGYVITEPLPAPMGGQVVYAQRGCMFTIGTRPEVYDCEFRPPLMGKPELTTPDQFDGTVVQSQIMNGDVWHTIQQTHPSFMTDIWQDRFVLQAVKDRTARVQLAVEFDHVQTLQNAAVVVNLKLKLAAGAVMTDRTLYDIGLTLPNQHIYPVAWHAVYARRDWQDFGLMHATDLHVSRRCDQNYGKLVSLGLRDSAMQYNDYNDGFRGVIRDANRLHAAGSLDLVIVTGDMVDYQYEDDDSHDGGGNFGFLERFMLGAVPSPSGIPGEELHVPIFMTLGNHDYRRVAYKLLFNAHVPVFSDPEFKNFAPHNLTRSDAVALQGGEPTVSADAALDMTKVQVPTAYFTRLFRGGVGMNESTYLIRLGPRHRIVMLDSKYDIGVLEGTWDAFLVEKLGIGDENKKSFADGAPNQIGFSWSHLDLVAQAQAEAGNEGVVIVGVHGPPLNIKGYEFNHYFRETEHPTADKKDIIGFLIRQDLGNFYFPGQPIFGVTLNGNKIARVDWEMAESRARSIHPNWMNSVGQPYFMQGSVADLLDYDSSHGEVDNFLKLCAGASTAGRTASRPVDLVLCGHGHNNVEYRVRWDQGKNEMQYFTDFYTENPGSYYGSRKAGVNFGQQRVAVTVREGARPNGNPSNASQDSRWAGEEWRLDVPPYPHPLSAASDVSAWWAQHRPLILETGGVGPMEGASNSRQEANKPLPNPSFQGYRVITVAGNHIAAIRYVKL